MRISSSMLNESAVNAILEDESELSQTQNELSTGLSINSPSDNPVGAVQVLELSATGNQYQQYISNGQSANSNLTLEENALSSATTTLQSVQSLLVQANSPTNSPSDQQSIATQIQQLEQSLLGTANSQNDQGQYLFAGYSVNTQPFVRGSSGSVIYVGDSGTTSVPLDDTTSVQTSDPGSSVFMNIPAGNGTFTTAASTSNTGSGVIDGGSVTDPSQWVPDQYTITFTDASDYQVTNSADAIVAQGTYNSNDGGQIDFNGIEVGISGVPAANDSFTIAPSGLQSVFDSLDSITSALNSAVNSSAARAQLGSQLAAAQAQVSQALGQVSNVTTSVGTRISLIGSLNTSLTTQGTAVQTQISNIDALNYAAATSQYSEEYTALQAAEASYAQIGQLTLFKYL